MLRGMRLWGWSGNMSLTERGAIFAIHRGTVYIRNDVVSHIGDFMRQAVLGIGGDKGWYGKSKFSASEELVRYLLEGVCIVRFREGWPDPVDTAWEMARDVCRVLNGTVLECDGVESDSAVDVDDGWRVGALQRLLAVMLECQVSVLVKGSEREC